MKNFMMLAMGIVLLAACKTKTKVSISGLEGDSKKADSAMAALLEPELYTDLYGNWVGNFSVMDEVGDEIEAVRSTIIITRITNATAEGKSLVKGNYRNLTGKVARAGNKYSFVMDEPGDDKKDGRFTFSIIGDTLSGKWQVYDKAAVEYGAKHYELVKTPFVYKANLMLPNDWDYIDYSKSKTIKQIYKNNDGTVDTFVNDAYRQASKNIYKLNASTKKLTEAQVKNLRKLDLEILRNTVFARHGYAFKSRRVRQFFDYVSWYIPVSDNIDAELSPIEKENIVLLQRFEQYAKDNYDTFGR